MTHRGRRGGRRPDQQLVITSRGFHFLLQDTHSQLWQLLLGYIEMADVRPRIRPVPSRSPSSRVPRNCAVAPPQRLGPTDLVDTLSLLFQLNFATLGRVRARCACNWRIAPSR